MMAKKKLPEDAFEFYFSLGHERSYTATASHYNVSKTAVCNRAKKENWPDRLRERTTQAEAAVAKKTTDTMNDMAGRHMKLIRFVQGKALEKLRSLPMGTTAEAVRAVETSIKFERMMSSDSEDTAQGAKGPLKNKITFSPAPVDVVGCCSSKRETSCGVQWVASSFSYPESVRLSRRPFVKDARLLLGPLRFSLYGSI